MAASPEIITVRGPTALSRSTCLPTCTAMPERGVQMPWHVQYRNDTVDRIVRFSNPEDAIASACRLIDKGCDVYGIGTGPLTDSIDRDQITRLYAMWVRAENPFGHKPDQSANAV